MLEYGHTQFDIQVEEKIILQCSFRMLDGKVKYLTAKRAVMESYLHILVVLAISAKIADANFHYSECDMPKL